MLRRLLTIHHLRSTRVRHTRIHLLDNRFISEQKELHLSVCLRPRIGYPHFQFLVGLSHARFTSIKMLDVTITNSLSMADHIREVISSCSRTLHAIRVLHAHGLSAAALQEVFRCVVIAKLMYAASAWCVARRPVRNST